MALPLTAYESGRDAVVCSNKPVKLCSAQPCAVWSHIHCAPAQAKKCSRATPRDSLLGAAACPSPRISVTHFLWITGPLAGMPHPPLGPLPPHRAPARRQRNASTTAEPRCAQNFLSLSLHFLALDLALPLSLSISTSFLFLSVSVSVPL